PTFYFSKHFNLAVNPASITALSLSSVLDDGMIVYINGVQVFSLGMPNNVTVAHNTYTNSCFVAVCTPVPNGRNVGDAILETASLPSSTFSSLVQGDNVIAVEVHPSSAPSSDVTFVLTLRAPPN